MLPGLTYFYCNSVSQGEREALGCGVGKEESNGVGGSAGPPSALAQGRLSRKAREGAHPQLSRVRLRDKSALYFAVKKAHPPVKKKAAVKGPEVQPRSAESRV